MTSKTRKYSLVAMSVAAILSVFSCERAPFYEGTDVTFAVSSESVSTKAVYGSDNGTPTTSQNIEWSEGDRIFVYCEQSSGEKSASYTVTEVHPSGTASNSYGKISHVGTHGLLWGTGTHTFYGIFPDVSQVDDASLEENEAVCVISASQRGTGTITGNADKVVPPDMSLLWMSAKNELSTMPEDGDVVLNFKTLSTVLEFTIENGFETSEGDMKVSSISLKSANHAICGSFNVDMDEDGLYGRPQTTLPTGATVADCDSVYIDFGTSPVTIAYGNTLNFTFFLSPGNDTEVDDLTFEIRGTNGWDDAEFIRRAVLKKADGDGVKFSSHKKTRISGLMVPESMEILIEDGNGDVIVTPWEYAEEVEIELQ